MKEPESVRSISKRLGNYFEWYLRIDPDAPSAVWPLVTRFRELMEGPANMAAAKQLLEETKGISLGSPWEELRAALAQLARVRA